jgi:hypothetical protein
MIPFLFEKTLQSGRITILRVNTETGSKAVAERENHRLGISMGSIHQNHPE